MTALSRLAALSDHAKTPLYRDAYSLIIANGLSAVLGVAYWALAARIFVPGELGVASVMISQLVFLSALTQFNTRVALLRFVPVTGAGTPRFVLLCYVAAGIGGIVIGAVVLATVGASFSEGLGLDHSLGVLAAVWFVASIALWSFFNIQDGLLTGLGKAPIVPFENGVYGLAKIGLLVFLGATSGPTAIFVSWTLPAAVLVAAVSLYSWGWLIPQHVRETGARSLPAPSGTILRFLSLDYVASLFGTATTALLPLVVVAATGPETGAYFYIPWIVVTTLSLVPLYLSASLTVQASIDRESLAIQVRRTLVHMARLLVPTVGLCILGAPVVLSLFGPSYAREGTELLRMAALGLLPYGVNVLFMAIARVNGWGRSIVAVQAILSITTVGLSALLLPWMGIVGVGLAWLTGNVVACGPVAWLGIRPLLRKTEAAAT